MEENSILACISSLVSPKMNEALFWPISLQELEIVVFQMKKGKAPSPDGFPIEFFQVFWEITKVDLLGVVQESQRNKKMLNAINSTFLVLILKREGAFSMDQFHPIALCNVVYNIITMLIPERLKTWLISFDLQ